MAEPASKPKLAANAAKGRNSDVFMSISGGTAGPGREGCPGTEGDPEAAEAMDGFKGGGKRPVEFFPVERAVPGDEYPQERKISQGWDDKIRKPEPNQNEDCYVSVTSSISISDERGSDRR